MFGKAYKPAKVHGIDIAVIMHKNGRYFTYRSLDQESWPPTMKQIVSRYSLFGVSIIDVKDIRILGSERMDSISVT